MSVPVSRRQFLVRAGAVVAALGPAGNAAWAWADSGWADAADAWSLSVLGDLHFDRLEHHDRVWLAREHPGDVPQVENYSRITQERTPSLLDRVRQTREPLARSGRAAPFVLQLGDLLEGLCGNAELAERHAREGLDFLAAARLGAPVVMTKGNHDITGPGAADVYQRVLLPWLSEPGRPPLREASFTRPLGGTLLALYDAYDRGSLDWFAQTLAAVRPRRLIVAIHPPVIPYNARSTWHVYSSPRQQAQRERLLDLLGRHQALVLCGHLHKFSLLVRRTPHGAITQLALSSVAATADGQPRDVLSGVGAYGPDLVDLEPRHAPEQVAARRAWLAAEQPFIERFEYADAWGHAVIRVLDERLSADVYCGLAERPWKTLDLSSAQG